MDGGSGQDGSDWEGEGLVGGSGQSGIGERSVIRVVDRGIWGAGGGIGWGEGTKFGRGE